MSASVAFTGLEQKDTFMEGGSYKGLCQPPAAEAQDGSPVSSGLDSTPTNWFELGATLCLEGRIPAARLQNAFTSVREALKAGREGVGL
jgi:hypothetical protein